MIRRSLGLVLLSTIALALTALAGPNEGGALIVHTDDSIDFTDGNYCTDYSAQLPTSCDEASTRTDKSSTELAVVWFLAAFHESASPSVMGVEFGVDHNLPAHYIATHQHCGAVDLPQGDWPVTGGTAMAYASPKTDLIFPIYYFVIWGDPGHYLGSGIHQEIEHAAFYDDADPSNVDYITRFGTVRCYADGVNECPGPRQTHFVNSDGTGDYPTIQAAINAAIVGDTISLADGTYTGDGNRDIDFLGKGILVKSQNGNPANCVIDCQGSEGEPHRGFYFHTYEDSSSVLQNVKITGGHADGLGVMENGGAIYCSFSSPTIAGCIVSENHAKYGGGVFCENASSPRITQCTFDLNTAEAGAALDFHDSSVTVLDSCSITSNTAQDPGGAIRMSNSDISIVDCQFIGNYASYGGAIHAEQSSPSIVSCLFDTNSATADGGAIRTFESSFSLSYCTLVGNSALEGGAIFSREAGTPTINNCTFYDNTAYMIGADIDCQSVLQLDVSNTIFAFGNSSSAIWCGGAASATLTCCNVYGNASGDWTDCISGQLGIDGNISVDPFFCDSLSGDFYLKSCSPCAAENNGECGRIGALPVGCADTIRVEADGSGDHATIQDAIDAAETCTLIELSDGTFTGVGNRDLDYGGKAITIKSQSGDPDLCIIDCEQSGRGFYFHNGETQTSSLEGVTITNGLADYGGGILCYQSSPTLVNLIVHANTASEKGGGVDCNDASPSLINCVLSENTADGISSDGGGFRCLEPSSNPTMTGCVLTGNYAHYGGGIFCDGGSYLTVSNCTLSGNSTPGARGVIHSHSSSHVDIESSIIAFSESSRAVTFGSGGTASFDCTNMYGNHWGNWYGDLADSLGVNGNISADPLFCDRESGNYSLQEASPCAPFTPPNDTCDLIGALPVGCATAPRACCVDGECQLATLADCDYLDGEWLADWEACDPNPCPYDSTHVVNPDGTGDFPTIQAAVDAASDGDIILLTNGYYLGDGNRDVDLLGKAITIRSQSGDPQTCVIDVGGDDEDPHFGFVLQNSETSETVIEAISITQGWSVVDFAGGMTCDGASPTIRNCIFEENNGEAVGGGVYCVNGAEPHFIDCLFDENDGPSSMGGAVLVASGSEPTFDGCTFYYNHTTADGGAVAFTNGTPMTVYPEFSNCLFDGNFAVNGGAIWTNQNVDISLTNCTFINNYGFEAGSGIYIGTGSNVTATNVIIAHGTVSAAVDSTDGGTVVFHCCDVWGNEGGNWVGPIAGQDGSNGNIEEDPIFCRIGIMDSDPHLHSGSPCALVNNPPSGCGRIGAFPIGCWVPEPSNLVAETQPSGNILLTWQDNASDETGFEMHRKTEVGGDWEIADSLAANVVSWEDGTVAAGTTYYYRVRTYNDTGYSPYSNTAGATAGTLPAEPTALDATTISEVRIDLSWTDNADDEIGFHLERRLGLDGEWEQLSPNPGANTTTFENKDLTPGTEYSYRVNAYNLVGSSAWSDTAMATTDPESDSFAATIIARFGTELAKDAIVYVNSGGGYVEKGTTDSSGELLVAELNIGDKIRVLKKLAERESEKDGHEAVNGLAWELWLGSSVIQSDGSYEPFTIETEQATYDVPLVHPVFRCHLVVSIDWNVPANSSYWTELEDGFDSASNYLYDVTDGQILFGDIAVYDNAVKRRDADVLIKYSENNHATIEGILRDSSNPTRLGRITMGRTFDGNLPDQRAWYRRLVREFCSYALGLHPEDENEAGLAAHWQAYRTGHPEEVPTNYGLMDYPDAASEQSSSNDYLKEYPPQSINITQQHHERGASCWDWVRDRVESYYPGIDITTPDLGWYPDNVTPDRTGPHVVAGIAGEFSANPGRSDASMPVGVKRFDSGADAFNLQLDITLRGNPTRNAHVYRYGMTGPVYLGETGHDGSLEISGAEEGDEIRIIYRGRRTSNTASITVVRTEMEDRTVKVDLAETAGVNLLKFGDRDVRPPGAAIETTPQGSASDPEVRIDIWADELLAGPPTVVVRYGATVESLSVSGGPAPYSATAGIELTDPLFDGRGLFEVAIEDFAGNVSSFLSIFDLALAQAGESIDMFAGSADLRVQGTDLETTQAGLISWSNAPVFIPPGFEPIPVSGLFSMHFSDDDLFPSFGGLNIGYDDADVEGLDETSLVILRWDGSGYIWATIDSSLVAPSINAVSVPIIEGGTYCVFAGSPSSDVTPPGQNPDFGGVGVNKGQGHVELDFISSGDDGYQYRATEYLLAYSEDEFDEEDWDDVPKLPGLGEPADPGMRELATVVLPEENHPYYLAIRTKDEAGNIGPISTLAYVISGMDDPNIPPAPPTDFRAVDAPADSGGAIDLSWIVSEDDSLRQTSVLSYMLYRNEPPADSPVLMTTLPTGTSSYTDTSAVTTQRYTYWLSAADSLEEVFAEENRAFTAKNLGVPVGDFSSDGKVGIDDLGHLVDTYAIDSTDTDYDPLFDLNDDGEIYTTDFLLITDLLGEGGLPTSVPEGPNADAQLFYRWTEADSSSIYLDIWVEGVTNLAGYSFKVSYSTDVAELIDTASDTGEEANILNLEGGVTPVFLHSILTLADGYVWIANAMKQPTPTSATDGNGFLARLTFEAENDSLIEITDIVLMDHEKLLNSHAGAIPASGEQIETALSTVLYPCRPNPFGESTILRFQIPHETMVDLEIFDVQGRLVRTLARNRFDAGLHSLRWDGRSGRGHPVACGVYLYRLKTTKQEITRKVVHLR